MIIAVIGNSSCSPEESRLAETVGELLAQRGATIVCGGLTGVMEAVCRGAKSEGGVTVGILPGEDATMANPWVDIPVVTGMGEARNVAVAKSAQAVIAIGGGYGTLSEIAYPLKSGIPVIGLNTWSLSRHGREDDSIIEVHDAKGAVDRAIALAKIRKREMNPTGLTGAIAKGIPPKLGKGVNIEPKPTKQYLSIYANGKLLVMLYTYKAYVTVEKSTKSKKGNPTSKKIIRVEDEGDVSIALEEIKKLYLGRNS